MTRVIAFANQKGGVAKTTSVLSLSAAMVERQRSVLVVDLDPQASLTYSMGVDPEALEASIHDVLLGRTSLRSVLVEANNITVVPANIDLAGAEVHLLTKPGREHILRKALSKVRDDYDYVMIDCPPSLGVLTINGLTAADEVIIPLQCETLGLRGMGQLLDTIEDIREFTNSGLAVCGVIASMYDGRTNLANEILESVRSDYKLKVLEPPIPKSVRVAESPREGRSILEHASRSKPAVAYRELAKRLDRKR